MGGACSSMGEKRGTYRVLGGNLRKLKPLLRPRRRWKDNIKLDIQVE